METTEQAAWDQRYSGPDLVWGAGPNRFVADEVATLPPGRAIGLGTGEGRNAIWLAERGWRVTAVDFSPALVTAELSGLDIRRAEQALSHAPEEPCP